MSLKRRSKVSQTGKKYLADKEKRIGLSCLDAQKSLTYQTRQNPKKAER